MVDIYKQLKHLQKIQGKLEYTQKSFKILKMYSIITKS